MTRNGRLAAAAAAFVLAVALLVLVLLPDRRGIGGQPASAERPDLLLLTSLPLVFPEDFTLAGGGSAALGALQSEFRVVPVATSEADALAGNRLLLMAQPNAQTAEALVDLDSWIRGGGRLLLLADPMLQWPSDWPMGDVLRPLPAFADTGLLAHWGLRLEGPDRPGPAEFELGGERVKSLSVGRLAATGPGCAADGAVARCRIGKGEAIIVADSDFLAVDRLGLPATNLRALVEAIKALGQ